MSDFFNTPKIATEEDCKLCWSCGKPGQFFRCALCGHKFVPGDNYTIAYTNDLPKAYGNPICCTSHGTVAEIREQWIERSRRFHATEADEFWFFHKHGSVSN